MRIPVPKRALALVILGASASSAFGQTDCSERRVSEFTFTEENDAIAAFSGSDEHYTQGLRLSWSLFNGCGPALLDTVGGRVRNALAGENEYSYSYALEFGQNFFTPNDITVAELIPEDRPYAGWLYVGTSFAFVDGSRAEDVTRQHQLELQVGIIGPEAQGEFVQREFHELIDDDLPQGWDNQLGTELGAQLYYTYQRRFASANRYFDFTPGMTAGLGSIQSLVGLNAIARFGTPNMRAFPVALITASVAKQAREPRKDWEAFIFAGTEGRAMFHNIYLDGNNFRDSHSVDKEGFVYDLKAGFSVRYKSFRFSYTFVRRSREFSPDPAGVDASKHDYGSLSISWEPV